MGAAQVLSTTLTASMSETRVAWVKQGRYCFSAAISST